MGGCNCDGPNAGASMNRVNVRKSTQSFSLTQRDGASTTFGSRLEAEAENARRGYTGKIKPV